MKIKCKKCGKIFSLPKGSLCSICFTEELGRRTDIENVDERFNSVQEYFQQLLEFEYERGRHNAICENLEIDAGINSNWEEA